MSREQEIQKLTVDGIDFVNSHLVAAWLVAYKPEVAEALMEEIYAQHILERMEYEPERFSYFTLG